MPARNDVADRAPLALRRSAIVGVTCFLAFALSGNAANAMGDDGPVSIIANLGKGFRQRDRALKEATDAVNAAGRVLTHRFGPLPDGDDGNRSRIVTLYANATAYQRVIRRRGAQAFEENLAMTDYGRRESHVALQPEISDGVIRRLGLPLLTRRLIAHEAAHLWCDARWPVEYVESPRWFREGIATWASEEAMRSIGQIDRIETDPFLAARVLAGQRTTDRLSNSGPPSRSYDPFSAFDGPTTYALDWAYFRWQLAAIDTRHANRDAGDSLRKSVADWLRDFERGSAGGMAPFIADLRAIRPEWDEKGRSLEIHGADWRQISFAGSEARAWRLTGPSTLPYRLKGSLEFVGDAGGHATVMLARDAQGFLAVTFRTFDGVAIRRYDESSQTWQDLAHDSAGRSAVGGRCEFEIVVGSEHVSVTIADRRACEAKTPGKRMFGPWGLSVSPGNTVRWQNLRIVSGMH